MTPLAEAADAMNGSAMVSSAVKGSRIVPVFCAPRPWGSGPIHSEKPYGSSRSALRKVVMFSGIGVPSSVSVCLALVEGPVAASAEPVAHGRYRVAREPAHIRTPLFRGPAGHTAVMAENAFSTPSSLVAFAEPPDQSIGDQMVHDHHLRCARPIEQRSAWAVRPGHRYLQRRVA
jgi:hypothetical protein